jgi:hypothetical protein
MGQTLSAEKLTLYDLAQRFGLRQAEDTDFFAEWQTGLLPLTEAEQQRLERVRSAYQNLAWRSLLENTVKLVVVSPLMDLAGLFFPPFYVSTEEAVEVVVADQDISIQGRLDVLVLKDQFWVLVIESKRAGLSLQVGIPQVLAYMLAAPSGQQSLYGLVTNGSNFVFLKLQQLETPFYARSREFVLENNDDLEMVLQVMKRLADQVGAES